MGYTGTMSISTGYIPAFSSVGSCLRVVETILDRTNSQWVLGVALVFFSSCRQLCEVHRKRRRETRGAVRQGWGLYGVDTLLHAMGEYGLFRYIHTHVHVHMCIYTHAHIHIYIYTYIHTLIYICICTHIHTYIRTCVRTYVHTYIYIYMYIYIYIHVLFCLDSRCIHSISETQTLDWLFKSGGCDPISYADPRRFATSR